MDNSATLPGIKHIKKETPVGKILGKASLYLILLVGAVIFIFPFFWMISSSLMTLGETIIRKFCACNTSVGQLQRSLDAG